MLKLETIKSMMYEPEQHGLAKYVELIRTTIKSWWYSELPDALDGADLQFDQCYRGKLENAICLSVIDWANGDHFWDAEKIALLLNIVALKYVRSSYFLGHIRSLVLAAISSEKYRGEIRELSNASVHAHLLQYLFSIDHKMPTDFWLNEIEKDSSCWIIATQSLLQSDPMAALQLLAGHDFSGDQEDFLSETEVILCRLAEIAEKHSLEDLQNDFSSFATKDKIPQRIADAIFGQNEYINSASD